jgi:hypothetical protein
VYQAMRDPGRRDQRIVFVRVMSRVKYRSGGALVKNRELKVGC